MKNNNKNQKKKFSIKSIVAKRGVYIALLTLIVVFGTVAVVRKFTANVSVSNSSFDDEAWEQALSDAGVDEEPENDTVKADAINEEEIPIVSDTTVQDYETVAAAAELSDDEIIQNLNMIAPCNGSISKEYSPDKLIYSKTMNDWRTHSGIDIAAPKGDIVAAAADGVVEKVYEDNNLGVVVVIGHGGSIKTLYGNLQDLGYIEVGRRVAKGDTIGAVGDTSILEKKDEAHLHFEVITGGETQNPSEYIPL